MSTTLVSIVMPVYNGQDHIKSSITSVMQQTHSNWELIIVDDCSSDETVQIIQSIEDTRINLIQNLTNQGVSSARNTALNNCKGSYIALLDADDISTPNRLKEQLSYMEEHNLDICGSFMKTFGIKNKNIHYPTKDKEIKHNLLFFKKGLSNSSVLLKKSSIASTRYNTDLNFAEDYDFWVQLSLIKKCKTGNIPLFLTHYRTHYEQASKKLKHKNQKALCSSLKNIPELNGLTEDQLKIHYDIWKKKKKLTINSFNSYLSVFNTVHSAITPTKDCDIYTHSLYQLCKKQCHLGRISYDAFSSKAKVNSTIMKIKLFTLCIIYSAGRN